MRNHKEDNTMATTTKSGLSLKHKIGYAMGDLGGCMTFALMGAMVTRYYTNVLKVDTTILAILLLVWNIWDAVNDPMMGVLMDKMYAKKRWSVSACYAVLCVTWACSPS